MISPTAVVIVIGSCVVGGLLGALTLAMIRMIRWEKCFRDIFPKAPRDNTASTPPDVISDQMREERPLPLGRMEFNNWSRRIISGAVLPMGEGEDPHIFIEGQTYALASMIMHLGPTEDHKPDIYFIKQLRKVAVNQVAHTILQEIKTATNERLKKAEEKPKLEVVNQT